LLNRLTEANIEGISVEILQLFPQYSRKDCADLLIDLMLEALCDPTQVLSAIIVPCSALITVLHQQWGLNIGMFNP